MTKPTPTTPSTTSSRIRKTGSRVVKEFECQCILFFEEVVQIFGVPKSVGQIYGLLYASPLPLSFSDIVERLDISKGSASQGLGLLRSLGAINEAALSVAGGRLPVDRADASRRVAYEPELSLRRLVNGVLQKRIAPMAATGTERLTRMLELAEHGGMETEFHLDRAEQLNTWRKRLKTVLPVLSALLGPKNRK